MSQAFLLQAALLLAQSGEEGERGYQISWAIIIASLLLGMMVALRPAKREEKVKLPKKQVEA